MQWMQLDAWLALGCSKQHHSAINFFSVMVVGIHVGICVGICTHTVGISVGKYMHTVGILVGMCVGIPVGTCVGIRVCTWVGIRVGTCVGIRVGICVGKFRVIPTQIPTNPYRRIYPRLYR